MKEIDCDSIRRHEARDVNFSQLTKVIKDAQANINSYIAQYGDSDFSVQIIGKLEPSLQNLHRLLALLFEKTVSTLNQEQLVCLTECNRVIANYYCAVRYFIQNGDKIQAEASRLGTQTNRLDYLFYYDAHYSLHTPFGALILFAYDIGAEIPETPVHFDRLFSSLFIIENRELIDELNHWINRLGEFMDEVAKNSRKWRDYE